MVDQKTIDRVAAAIDSADVSYSMSLIRLVEGVSTYRLEINGSVEEFTDDDIEQAIDQAYARIRQVKQRKQAEAVIAALSPSPSPNSRLPDTSTIAAHMRDFRAFVAKTAPKLHWKIWQDLGADPSLSNGGYDGWQHGFGQAQFGPLPLPQLIEEMKTSLSAKASLATTEGSDNG